MLSSTWMNNPDDPVTIPTELSRLSILYILQVMSVNVMTSHCDTDQLDSRAIGQVVLWISSRTAGRSIGRIRAH
jgi:hypothetical protein